MAHCNNVCLHLHYVTPPISDSITASPCHSQCLDFSFSSIQDISMVSPNKLNRNRLGSNFQKYTKGKVNGLKSILARRRLQIKPISVRYGLGKPDHDAEGRIVTVEFEKFYLLSAYVPNSSDGLKRLPYRITQWDPSLSKYIKDLEQSKPVVLTGDLNCAHQEIDIYNPAVKSLDSAIEQWVHRE